MVKLFRALVFRHRLKKQIRLADERKRRTGKKQFVINLGGRPLCVSKEHIRRLAAERFYRPGGTVADVAAERDKISQIILCYVLKKLKNN